MVTINACLEQKRLTRHHQRNPSSFFLHRRSLYDVCDWQCCPPLVMTFVADYAVCEWLYCLQSYPRNSMLTRPFVPFSLAVGMEVRRSQTRLRDVQLLISVSESCVESCGFVQSIEILCVMGVDASISRRIVM